MQRTSEQNTKLHALIGELTLGKDIKSDLVYEFSGERCTSSKDLTIEECARLISYLERITMSERKRKEAVRQKIIWRLYFTIRDKGYLPVQTGRDAMESLQRMTEKIWHKKPQDMTFDELNACIGIVRNWKIKKECQKS